jgi:CheY-like chemotaxis protein
MKPDLILMDIQLPEISWMEVTKVAGAGGGFKEDPGDRSDELCDDGR